ncbi:MAG: radical SAM protein [Bacteroidaceae bacterium]|nr:radical SAM protein [Bacteroidaceae bacterium]
MPTILFPSPIFGPVNSRRLGVSLGVNLLPENGKICTFDCLYCECGFNTQNRSHSPLPTREEVYKGLEEQLKKMQDEGRGPDVITFAGNGEPTLHPNFAEIIDDTIALRDRYFPKAKVSVLSNSTMLGRKSVFEALKKVDNNILKLDTIDPSFISLIDRPNMAYKLNAIIERMKEFKGALVIQTMFLKGEVDNLQIDNTTDQYVLPWIETVKEIAPREVMIYTIDRETPHKGLKKATREELDSIVEKLHKAGLKATASY